MTILRLFFSSMTSALPRTTIFPFPVVNASMMPFLPKTIPPVGKSGPLMSSIMVSKRQLGFLMRWIVPSMTSDKLWGGISVAKPAAIPFAPLISKAGKRVGNTVGSFNVSSKLNVNSTVSSSISFNNSIATEDNRASV